MKALIRALSTLFPNLTYNLLYNLDRSGLYYAVKSVIDFIPFPMDFLNSDLRFLTARCVEEKVTATVSVDAAVQGW